MSEGKHVNEWSLADGAAHLDDVVQQAAAEPQTLTRDGEAVAVVVGMEEWRRTRKRKGSLSEFLQTAPDGFADLDFARTKGSTRDLGL